MGSDTGDPPHNPLPCMCSLNAISAGSRATHALLDASHLHHCYTHKHLLGSPDALWTFALDCSPAIRYIFIFFECVAQLHKPNRPNYPKTTEEQQSRAHNILRLNAYRTRMLENHPKIQRVFSLAENDHPMSWAMAHLANELAFSEPDAVVEIWSMDTDFLTTTGSKYTVMFCPTRRRYPCYHPDPIRPCFSFPSLTTDERNAIVYMRSLMGNNVYWKGASGLETQYQALTPRNLQAVIKAGVFEDLFTQSARVPTYQAIAALKKKDRPHWTLTPEEEQTVLDRLADNDLRQYEAPGAVIYGTPTTECPNRAFIFACVSKALDATFLEAQLDRIAALTTDSPDSCSAFDVTVAALYATLHVFYPPPHNSDEQAWKSLLLQRISDGVENKPVVPGPPSQELCHAIQFFLPCIAYLVRSALRTSVNPAALTTYLSRPEYLALVYRQHQHHQLPPARVQAGILAGRLLPFPPYNTVRPLTLYEKSLMDDSRLNTSTLSDLLTDTAELSVYERATRELADEAEKDKRWDLMSRHIYRENRELLDAQVIPRELMSVITLHRFAKAHAANDFPVAQAALTDSLEVTYYNVLNTFESILRSITDDDDLLEFLDELVPPQVRSPLLLQANTRFEFEYPAFNAYCTSKHDEWLVPQARVFADAYERESAPSFGPWFAIRLGDGASTVKFGSQTISRLSKSDTHMVRQLTDLLRRSSVISDEVAEDVLNRWPDDVSRALGQIASSGPWASCSQRVVILCSQWSAKLNDYNSEIRIIGSLRELLGLDWLSSAFHGQLTAFMKNPSYKLGSTANLRQLAEELSRLLPDAFLREAAFHDPQEDDFQWITNIVAPYLHGTESQRALAVNVAGHYAVALDKDQLAINNENIRSPQLYQWRYLDFALRVAVYADKTSCRRFNQLQLLGLWVLGLVDVMEEVALVPVLQSSISHSSTLMALLHEDSVLALRSAGITTIHPPFLCDVVLMAYVDQPSFAVSANLIAAICLGNDAEWQSALRQGFPRQASALKAAASAQDGLQIPKAPTFELSTFLALLYLAGIPPTSQGQSKITFALAKSMIGIRFTKAIGGREEEPIWCLVLFLRLALRILVWVNDPTTEFPTWAWCKAQLVQDSNMSKIHAGIVLENHRKIEPNWLNPSNIHHVRADFSCAFLSPDVPAVKVDWDADLHEEAIQNTRARLLDIGRTAPPDERWSTLQRFPLLDHFAHVSSGLALLEESRERLRQSLIDDGMLLNVFAGQNIALQYRPNVKAKDIDLDDLSD
ncbi:hypothetical protein C8F01DRAFT_1102797 [Mycena amicta]|nr:hypothetical protein C8F01DRAFT_1102797 [Mycena amicta]